MYADRKVPRWVAALGFVLAALVAPGGASAEDGFQSGTLSVTGVPITDSLSARVEWDWRPYKYMAVPALEQRVRVLPSATLPEGCESVGVDVEVDVYDGNARLGVHRKRFSPVYFGAKSGLNAVDSNAFENDVDGASQEAVDEAFRKRSIRFANLRVQIDSPSAGCTADPAADDATSGDQTGEQGGAGSTSGSAGAASDATGGGERGGAGSASGSSGGGQGGASGSEQQCREGPVRHLNGNRSVVYRCSNCTEFQIDGYSSLSGDEVNRRIWDVCGTSVRPRSRDAAAASGATGGGGTGASVSTGDGAASASGASQAGEPVGGAAPVPVVPMKTPDEAVSELRAAMDTGDEVQKQQLAAALAKSSKGEVALYLGAFAGGALYAYVGLSGDDDEDDGAGIPADAQVSDRSPYLRGLGMPALSFLVSSAAGVLLGADPGDERQKRLLARSEQWKARLRDECERGAVASCRAHIELSRKLADLFRPASERELSSPAFGLGSFWGPAWELRGSTGLLHGSLASTAAASPGFAGSLTGATTELVARWKAVRMSASVMGVWGQMLDDEGFEGRLRQSPGQLVAGGGLGLGVQLSQGLFSPYAEARKRWFDVANDPELAIDDPDGNYGTATPIELPTTGDTVLVVGNTFNFGGLWSSTGPRQSSFVVDVAYQTPLGDSIFESGFSVTAGFSVRAPFDFSEYEEPAAPAPAEVAAQPPRFGSSPDSAPAEAPAGLPPRFAASTPAARQADPAELAARRERRQQVRRQTKVLGFAFALGAGVELFRHSDAAAAATFTSTGSLWGGLDEGRFDTAGAWVKAFGLRTRLGQDGVHELGALFGYVGAQWSRRYDRPEGMERIGLDGRVEVDVVGLVPSAFYYRNDAPGFPVELGLRVPLLWLSVAETIDDSHTTAFFDGPPPALLYAGAGF